jgi:hypothetical protein
MNNSDRVVWWFLASFGAFAPLFSIGIYLTEDKASGDILTALICAALSFSSLTLCVSSLMTTFRSLTKSNADENTGAMGKAIFSLAIILIMLIFISIFYWKIVSKILTAEIVSPPYLAVVFVFLVTLFLSFRIMKSFERGIK